MHIVVGPVLSREGGFAFDSWTPEEGIGRGYTYRRIGDAYYARNVEIKSRKKGYSDRLVVACSTVDEFVQSTEMMKPYDEGSSRCPRLVNM